LGESSGVASTAESLVWPREELGLTVELEVDVTTREFMVAVVLGGDGAEES